MRRSAAAVGGLAVLAISLGATGPADAWGYEGHRIVASIARGLLARVRGQPAAAPRACRAEVR